MAMMLGAINAFALRMGFNEDIHNGTGQDAYDFHIEGTLKSSTPPKQLANYIYPVSPIPGFDWTYDGGTITHMGGNIYHYSGGWSGTTPVKTSQSIHVGKYWDETCHNIFVDVVGWWTDRDGNRITTNTSDVPLVGFDVQDHILNPDVGLPQTLTLYNANPEVPMQIMGLQVATLPSPGEMVELPDLVEDSEVLAQLEWTDFRNDSFFDVFYEINLTEAGFVIPADTFMVTRGYVLDPTDGLYHFFAHAHTSHVPEPGSMALIGVGLLALMRKK